uniref:Uncharacterized protein n=1 Tax=Anguilla anguilla TaxID=7936 RepID=A0A0E9S308_ANGAN
MQKKKHLMRCVSGYDWCMNKESVLHICL